MSEHREDCPWKLGFDLQMTRERLYHADETLQVHTEGIIWWCGDLQDKSQSVKFAYCPMCGVKL